MRKPRSAYERRFDDPRFRILIRLPEDDMEELRDYAKRTNQSVAEAIRCFVTWGLEIERPCKPSKALHSASIGR